MLHGFVQRQIQPLLRVVHVVAGKLEFVDHDLDGVVLVAVEFHALRYFQKFAIYAGLYEALVANLLEQLLVMPLAVLYHRREYEYTLAGILLKNETDDLFVSIMHHLFARKIRIGIGCTGVQKSQKIIYFCDCADRRARIANRSALVDTDYR